MGASGGGGMVGGAKTRNGYGENECPAVMVAVAVGISGIRGWMGGGVRRFRSHGQSEGGGHGGCFGYF